MIGWRTFMGPAVAIALAVVLIFTGVMKDHHSGKSNQPRCGVDSHLISMPTSAQTTAKQALEGWAWLVMKDHSYTQHVSSKTQAYFVDAQGRWGFAAVTERPGRQIILGMIPQCKRVDEARAAMTQQAQEFTR